MTLTTKCFLSDKKDGKVTKVGTCGFADGMKWCERVLWDWEKYNGTHEEIVMLNGEAHVFKRSKWQSESVIKGWI